MGRRVSCGATATADPLAGPIWLVLGAVPAGRRSLSARPFARSALTNSVIASWSRPSAGSPLASILSTVRSASATLDDAVVSALDEMRKRQMAEGAATAPAYEASGYVVTDELGRPVHPKWYSDEFHRWRSGPGSGGSGCTSSGIPRCR